MEKEVRSANSYLNLLKLHFTIKSVPNLISIFIDFDGTITLKDLAFQILEEFATGDWKRFDIEYEDGSITLIDMMEKQFNMIKGDMIKFKRFIDEVVEFRSGFKEFLNFCELVNIETTILSAGLDFAIEYCLEKLNIDINFIAVKTKLEREMVKIDPSSVLFENGLDFKSVKILSEQKRGKNVIMIGDGSTDKQAATKADFTIAVKNSSLDFFCEENKINYDTFENFTQIPKILKNKGFLN